MANNPDNLSMTNPENNHAHDENPAFCEDFPCCGHEHGDCNGQKYGSDESIKQAVYDRFARGEQDDDYGDWDY